MKLRVLLIASFVALTCISFHAAAQDAVADLLAKVPFQSTQEGEEVAAALLALGPEAIRSICDRLVPMGEGDDNAARYALSAMANFVMRDGASAERSVFNGALIAALAAETETEVKAFILERFAITGEDSVVDTVAPLLTDETFADPAARVLIEVNSPKAQEAIVSALSIPQGRSLLSVVQAAGALHADAAMPKLIELFQGSDGVLHYAVLAALAEILGEESEELMAALLSEEYDHQPETLPMCLRYAERRLELGDADFCVTICRLLLRQTERYKPPHETSAALSLLVRAKGERALPDLIAATANDSPEVRAAALELAATLDGGAAIAKWIEVLPTARAEARPDIVRMLGKTGDRAARNTIIAAMKDDDMNVRLAAIEAAPGFGGRRVVDNLLDALGRATERDEVNAVGSALRQFSAEDVAGPLGEALPALPASGKKTALDVLAVRRATSQKEIVFACVNDPEPDVRRAAIEALGSVAEASDLSRCRSAA